MGGSSTTTSSIELGGQTNFEQFLSGIQLDKAEQDRLQQLKDKQTAAAPLKQRLQELEAKNSTNPVFVTEIQRIKNELRSKDLQGGEAGELENLLKKEQQAASSVGAIQRQFQSLEGLVDAGAGQSDVERSTSLQRQLEQELGLAADQGLQPSQQDIAFGTQSAADLFAEERVRLGQSFQTQQQDTASLAASLGRAVDDPILQAKLRTGFMQEQAAQQAREQGFARELAMQQPGQRLALRQQQAGIAGGLAQQAFQNRAAILGLGSELQAQERNFRLAQATRTEKTTSSPGLGGVLGGIAGAAGGLFSGGGSLLTGLKDFKSIGTKEP